jgi:signal transduction histidine kinase
MALRELLTLALLGGFVHDVGSPLAALTSNLSVARELATADDEDSRGELREVIDDLQMATTRLTELASDLRGYVGLPVGRGTFEELALTALRLGRSHLARRAQVDVAIDPELKPELPPSRVLRTLGELVVAVTHELQSGSRRHLLTIRTDPSGFVIELAPPPPGDVEAPVAIATSRLTQPAQISRTAERLVVRVPLAWS